MKKILLILLAASSLAYADCNEPGNADKVVAKLHKWNKTAINSEAISSFFFFPQLIDLKRNKTTPVVKLPGSQPVSTARLKTKNDSYQNDSFFLFVSK